MKKIKLVAGDDNTNDIYYSSKIWYEVMGIGLWELPT
jgi:hypothetical protein